MLQKLPFKAIAASIIFIGIVGAAQPAQAAWMPPTWSPLAWLWFGKKSVANKETRDAAQQKPVNQLNSQENAQPTTESQSVSQPILPEIAERISEQVVEKTQAMEQKKIVAAWYTPWGDDSYHSFKNNLNVLTEIHPFIYSIGSDGYSIVRDEGDWRQEEVMRLAKQHNIKVIPTIHSDNVNYSDMMLNDPAKRAAHIEEIVRVIEANGYDGINIDLEGFRNGYNRDVYAAFMKELSARLKPMGKIVAISIEAYNQQQNWESFGQSVDRFMIMGYDYHAATTSEVGPIGPANWLKEIIAQAKARVPAEKIVMGIGSYGYAWIHNGSNYVSEAVGYQDALNIAKATGSTIEYDADNTPHFSYNRGFGQRHLYFEDARSTQPKLQVIQESGIGGMAMWRLGTEDPKVWPAVDTILE